MPFRHRQRRALRRDRVRRDGGLRARTGVRGRRRRGAVPRDDEPRRDRRDGGHRSRGRVGEGRSHRPRREGGVRRVPVGVRVGLRRSPATHPREPRRVRGRAVRRQRAVHRRSPGRPAGGHRHGDSQASHGPGDRRPDRVARHDRRRERSARAGVRPPPRVEPRIPQPRGRLLRHQPRRLRAVWSTSLPAARRSAGTSPDTPIATACVGSPSPAMCRGSRSRA